MNKALKEIANICSIKKKVHFHVARHSFATNFLRKGGKIEDLQVIMDHSDIQTTMVYVHIVRAESVKSIYLISFSFYFYRIVFIRNGIFYLGFYPVPFIIGKNFRADIILTDFVFFRNECPFVAEVRQPVHIPGLKMLGALLSF